MDQFFVPRYFSGRAKTVFLFFCERNKRLSAHDTNRQLTSDMTRKEGEEEEAKDRVESKLGKEYKRVVVGLGRLFSYFVYDTTHYRARQ